ncbi:MAG: hypothetical protein M3R43_06010 [Acidobacteriota bacterium]|nr:hypothetical protein [Acidobacteriota bacterium]
MSVVAVVHGLHLLELVGGKDAGKLLLGRFMDGVHLILAALRVETGVGAESFDFLLAVGEDGFDPSGLVGGEVEFVAQAHCHLVGVMFMLSCLLLGNGETSAKGKYEGCGEENAFHVVLLVVHCGSAGRNSLRLCE